MKLNSYWLGRVRSCFLFLLLLATLGLSRGEAAKKEAPVTTDMRPVLISGVRPEYPYEARRDHITGRGIVVMKIDPVTGNVASCEMAQSTGSDILDEAVLVAVRQWHFKPGAAMMVKTPVMFTMDGVFTDYHVKGKPVDQALAHFLGRGTVENGPSPAYPRSVPWTNKQGKGVYEIHVRKDGIVSEVKILHQSGDEMFDRTTVDTLRTWRFRRGPLIVELPLAFRLTPTNYSVAIPKGR
jgi:TonB family protein